MCFLGLTMLSCFLSLVFLSTFSMYLSISSISFRDVAPCCCCCACAGEGACSLQAFLFLSSSSLFGSTVGCPWCCGVCYWWSAGCPFVNLLLLIAFYILWCSLALLNCFLSLDVGPCAKLPDPFIPPYSARSVSWGVLQALFVHLACSSQF